LTKETKKLVKENAKAIGELGRRFGESVEYMVAPNLVKRFKELNYVFTRVFQNKYVNNSRDAVLAEVDTFLENGDKIAAVEAKVKPSIEDVKDHIKRMEKLRVYADAHNDKRKYLGAIAGMGVKQNVKDFALKNGFFVLEPSSSTFSITAPSDSPREW
jgi:molybdopterin converting factor small subunit